jgi:alpha-D-xyloside xylohydrolase
MSELNPPDRAIPLLRQADAGAARLADVTTTQGNARVERRDATFAGSFTVAEKGRYAFLLDSGRKMASRHYVEIDGKVQADFSNLWLPPTASFIAELDAGEHRVRVLANSEDAPTLHHGLS